MNRFSTRRRQLPPNGAKVTVKLSNFQGASSSSSSNKRNSFSSKASSVSSIGDVKNNKNRSSLPNGHQMSPNGQVNVQVNGTGGNNVTGCCTVTSTAVAHRASSPSTKSSASSSCSSSCFSSTSNYSTSSSSSSGTTATTSSSSSSSWTSTSKGLMYKGSGSGCGKIRSIQPPSNQSSSGLSSLSATSTLFTIRPTSSGLSPGPASMKEGPSMSITKETVTGGGGKKNALLLRTSPAVATVTNSSKSTSVTTTSPKGGGGGITVAKVSPLPVGKKDTSITKQPSMSIITSSTCSSCNSPPPPAPPSPVGANTSCMSTRTTATTTTSCSSSKSTPCDGHSSPFANKKVILLPHQRQVTSPPPSPRPSSPVTLALTEAGEVAEKRQPEQKNQEKEQEEECKGDKEKEDGGGDGEGEKSAKELSVKRQEGCKYTTIGTNDQNEWTTKVHSQRNTEKVETTQAWIDDGSFSRTNQPILKPSACQENEEEEKQHGQEEGCGGKDLTMHLKVHSSESENELSPYNEDHLSLLTVTTDLPPLDTILNHDHHHHHHHHHQHHHHPSLLLDNSSLLPPNLKLMIESYKVRSSSKHLAPGKFLSPGCNNHTSHNSHIIGNGQIVTSSPFTVSTLASDADENKMDLNKRNTSTGYRSGSKNHHHHISTLSVNNAGYWSFSPSSAPESIVSDQDAASSREIKDLQSQVKFSKEKVSDLTSQLFANAQMMSAFEKTLSTLSMKLQQLSLVNHQKDIEISRLRAVTDVMIAYKAEQEKCSKKSHTNKQQTISSCKSTDAASANGENTFANSLPSSPSKRLWIKSTLNKAFLKNKILQSPSKKIHTDTQVTNSPSGTLSQTSSSSSSLSCGWSGDGDKTPCESITPQVHSINCKSAKSSENEFEFDTKMPSDSPTPASTNATSVSCESLKELREKLNKADSILEKTRLEAITSAFHLESTKELVNTLKEEAMYLRRQHAQLELAVKKKQSLVHSTNHLHQEQQQQNSHQQLLLC